MEKAKSFTNTMKVSVPYRGATFLNSNYSCIDGQHRLVSVPYRGATFLNLIKQPGDRRSAAEFPSPIGELHFSIVISELEKNLAKDSFRPLSGSYISQ